MDNSERLVCASYFTVIKIEEVTRDIHKKTEEDFLPGVIHHGINMESEPGKIGDVSKTCLGFLLFSIQCNQFNLIHLLLPTVCKTS